MKLRIARKMQGNSWRSCTPDQMHRARVALHRAYRRAIRREDARDQGWQFPWCTGQEWIARGRA